VLFLLIGLAFMGWAGCNIYTGRGYYRGCPPGGYRRTEDPFNFWLGTLFILAGGIFLILGAVGVIDLPSRRP